MGKVLVVAEKPSVGRDIAKVLGCSKRGEGWLGSDNYIVSWAIGHLVTLYEPEDYDKSLKKWNFNKLPIIPENIMLKPVKSTEKQYKILKGFFESPETVEIICATDSGREGELIFRYIYSLAKCDKPVKRLWISSMTEQAIAEGFRNLKDGEFYDNLYLSAKCRSEADWLVGINASRAYTLTYDALLSVGRVQTPTLAIMVDRHKEIEAFIPQDYFIITAFFDGYLGKWFEIKDNSPDMKIVTESKADEILEKIAGKEGIITNIEQDEKKQPPPFLFDLTELQRECNIRFGLSAQQTLSAAQDLYEKHKLITYPRTDSRFLSSDMIPKLNPVINKLGLYDKYAKYVNYIKELRELPVSKRIVDNEKITDHHAIIPTEISRAKITLSKNEDLVYDIIARRFLSVFYPAYVYNITRITTEIDTEKFMTKGTTIINDGYMVLYKDFAKPEKKKNDEDEDVLLPDVKLNQSVRFLKAEKEKKKTAPPKPYTEASLLSAMENARRFVEDEALKESMKESGLGTPATRAAIIERLIHVEYIKRKGKSLIPTEKGIKLIGVVPRELKSPETTGKWEKGLNNIAKGKMDPERFMGSINRYVQYIINESAKKNADIQFPQEKKRFGGAERKQGLGKCPDCGEGEIFENSKSFYCSKWKSGCNYNIWKDSTKQYGIELTPGVIESLLKGEKTIVAVTMPHTLEKGNAELVSNPKIRAKVEIINFVRGVNENGNK